MINVARRWKALIGSFVLLVVVALAVVGCQSAGAAAQPTAPAATGAGSHLIINADIVQGTQNLTKDLMATNGCVLNNRFPRNAEIVWRARIYDPRTGNLMNKTQLSKVEIMLANGHTIAMDYGPHPKNPPGEAYWTGSWVVPKDAPTGSLSFSIVATGTDGRTGEYKPFNVPTSLPTILDQTLPDVTQGSKS